MLHLAAMNGNIYVVNALAASVSCCNNLRYTEYAISISVINAHQQKMDRLVPSTYYSLSHNPPFFESIGPHMHSVVDIVSISIWLMSLPFSVP